MSFGRLLAPEFQPPFEDTTTSARYERLHGLSNNDVVFIIFHHYLSEDLCLQLLEVIGPSLAGKGFLQ